MREVKKKELTLVTLSVLRISCVSACRESANEHVDGITDYSYPLLEAGPKRTCVRGLYTYIYLSTARRGPSRHSRVEKDPAAGGPGHVRTHGAPRERHAHGQARTNQCSSIYEIVQYVLLSVSVD
jgi:hypothetical protein